MPVALQTPSSAGAGVGSIVYFPTGYKSLLYSALLPRPSRWPMSKVGMYQGGYATHHPVVLRALSLRDGRRPSVFQKLFFFFSIA